MPASEMENPIIMQANRLIKTIFHLLAAALTAGYVIDQPAMDGIMAILIIMTLLMVAAAFMHQRVFPKFALKTPLFFLAESLVLSFIAWLLFRQGETKAPFLYEGVGVFFLSLSAFSFLLRRKKGILQSEYESG
jgi:hypothetical protein